MLSWLISPSGKYGYCYHLFIVIVKRETNKQTNKQEFKQTDRQKDRKTIRQTDKQKKQINKKR